GWWNGALFDYYAKRPAANRTKQRLVALLREHYAGDWDRFARDFVPPAGVGTFDGLLARRDCPRLRPGGAGIEVIRRWTGLVAERARGAAAAAERFARQPTVVGSHWFQYYDHPRGGREDGEDYDFGLVDIDDRPYEALVDALARTNVRLAAIHREAADDPPPHGTWAIPRADIDPGDRSLADCPQDAALVPVLATPRAEVPFGV